MDRIDKRSSIKPHGALFQDGKKCKIKIGIGIGKKKFGDVFW